MSHIAYWLLLLLPPLLLLQAVGCNDDALDASKAPCDNFHEHACGNWHAAHSLRALGAHDMRSKLSALSRQQLVQHFEAGGNEPATQLSSFYSSCLGGRQSLPSYMRALQQRHAHWPLLSANATTTSGANFDWAAAQAALRQFGANGLWRLLVQPNWQAAEQRIFYLLAPSFEQLGLGEMSEFLHERYLKYLLLELKLRVRRAAALAAQLVQFEQRLRALQSQSQSLVLHAPQQLQQLAAQLPQLQLLRYFELLLGARYTPQLLVVADIKYLEQLQQLFAAQQVDELIGSSWLLLQLPTHFELLRHEESTLAEQRVQCLRLLQQLLPQPLAALHLRLLHGSAAAGAQFMQRTQQRLQTLFDSLKLQFERLLNATQIFKQDADTQLLALEKLRAMRLLLPPALPTELPTVKAAAAAGLGYDEQLLQLSQSQAQQQFGLALDCLQLPCEAPPDHALGPLDVNVYYRLKQNAIELPLGLLRAPLLDAESQNQTLRLLAGLGYMLAHELLHGFDYDGINYDAKGRIMDASWPPRAIIRFGLRANCYLGERYSNATLTINENIADSEGLRLAFDTYQQQQQLLGSGSGAALATREFFVAFAQNWCGQQPAGASGQHASHKERVNNVLGNFPEFAEAFECKPGSLMHPSQQCRIW
ncbi:CG3775 [Drosophila busckii]|uniref:CG3775 n=1 Tax=Drosophila busckii TaxID=30019 RepID=A0A0M4EJF6_DROBS|nr:CG3775 [Drosophila busckii]